MLWFIKTFFQSLPLVKEFLIWRGMKKLDERLENVES